MDWVTWKAAPRWTHMRNRQTIQKFRSAAPISCINITTCSPKWYTVTVILLGYFNPEWFLKQTKIQRQTWNFHNFSRFLKLKGCKKEMLSTFPIKTPPKKPNKQIAHLQIHSSPREMPTSPILWPKKSPGGSPNHQPNQPQHPEKNHPSMETPQELPIFCLRQRKIWLEGSLPGHWWAPNTWQPPSNTKPPKNLRPRKEEFCAANAKWFHDKFRKSQAS